MDGDKDFPEIRREPDRPRRGRSGLESLVAGLAIAAAFSSFWFFGGTHMMRLPFPLVFIGLFIALRGFRRMLAERAAEPRPRRLNERERLAEDERTVLRVARAEAGRLTPALVAVNSTLTLEEAEKTLEALTRKGHASMRVRDDGRIVYEFEEFIPKT